MSRAREQFRRVLARPTCTLAANIFDPLSARIAHMGDSLFVQTIKGIFQH